MDDSSNTTGRSAAPSGAAPQAGKTAPPDRGDDVFALAPEHRAKGGAEPPPPAPGAAASDPDGVFALTPAHRVDAGASPESRTTGSATADPPGAAAPERERSVADHDGAGAQVAQTVQRELERILGAEAAPDLRGFVADEVRRALRAR